MRFARLSSLLVFIAASRVLALTAGQWQADVDVFARELPRRHMNAFHHVTREQFDAAVAALRARAATANDDEMYMGLMQITAMVGDAHTYVGSYANPRRIPIAVAFFGDDVRVVRATDASRALLGAKLIAIEGMPIDAVTQKLRTILSQDETDDYVRGLLPGWIVSSEALHGLNIVNDPAQIRVTFDTGGAPQTTTLASISFDADLPLTVSTRSIPLMRQNPGESFAVTWLEPSKTVYVAFRNYKDLGRKSRALWELVDAKPVEKIVIDLRQNGGGDYKVGHRHLVSELVKRPRLKTYVLIGRLTFSAAMNNAVQFRNEAHATLVGQPIGERPNSYQERRSFALPNSGLHVSYSTEFYKFVPDDAPNQVIPDKRIDPSWDDFLAGRDAALEWVLAQ